jgi:hypothetical protein
MIDEMLTAVFRYKAAGLWVGLLADRQDWLVDKLLFP